MPTLIIINGAPGAGKTTLLRRLANELGLPAIASHDIKEFLFDALGYSNRDWSRILGRASVESLYVIAKEFVVGGQSVMIESAFWPEFASPVLSSLVEELHVEVLEIYCHTDDETRMLRFRARQDTGERHPGHVDNLATLRDVTQYGPLAIGEVIKYDTTDPTEHQYQQVLEAVRARVH